jgi:L-phenylalanine/L-methionine N-acetyltransferase
VTDVLIRAMAAGDVERVTEIYNQRLVAAMTMQILYTSESERAARFASSESQRMLVAELDDRLVGHGGLTLYSRRRAHVGSIGMGVDQACHGQGVGTALLAALVDLADNWYNLRRIELEVYTDNEAAIRLYKRFGFVVEGTHRSYVYRDGAWADAYSMARLRDEPSLSTEILT